MGKMAIVVVALLSSLFIGSAIAVRHIGHGETVCSDTMSSDEDDYQKEIIAKFGELYFDSSENPEGTTSGMAMWCANQEKRYKNRVAAYFVKFDNLSLSVSLKGSLKQENDCWNKLEASLNKFDAMYFRLYYYTGGTMAIICQADAPMNIAFIRQACLKDDYAVLGSKEEQSPAKMMDVDASAWDREMQQVLVSVKYESQDEELIKSYGSVLEYKQLYRQMKENAAEAKALLTKWINLREATEQLLPKPQQGNYRMHTLKVVNALAYHLYSNRTFEE